MICDLRGLNSVPPHPPPPSGSLGDVVAFCKKTQNWQWGVTLDMKDFFHHVPLHPQSRRWMRIHLGEAWEYPMSTPLDGLGVPFGHTDCPNPSWDG